MCKTWSPYPLRHEEKNLLDQPQICRRRMLERYPAAVSRMHKCCVEHGDTDSGLGRDLAQILKLVVNS